MAKTRMVNTRFWNDGFVAHLDPIEKLLFIYFITNEHTDICGIYELPMKIAAVETGIDPSMFEKVIPRLAPKILFLEGWIIVQNFPKYQHMNLPKVKQGYDRSLGLIPQKVVDFARENGYFSNSDDCQSIANALPTGNLDPDLELNTTMPDGIVSPSSEKESELEIVAADEDGNELPAKWNRKPKTPKLVKWPVARVATRFGELCQKHIGIAPTGHISVLKAIQRAFEIHKMTEEQIYDLFDEWFSLGKPDENTIQIRQALSDFNINRYRAANQ